MLRATLLALLALPACHGLVVATAQPLRGNAASTPLPANVAAKAAEAMAPAAPAVKVASLTRVADFEKATANADRLTVVKFFAPWCRACKAMEPKYKRTAARKADAGAPIDFYEVSIQEGKEIFKHCKIETIPTALVYCDGQVVASAAVKASAYKKFEDALVLAERRLSTGYFPVNSCEVYSCQSDDPELTHLSSMWGL